MKSFLLAGIVCLLMVGDSFGCNRGRLFRRTVVYRPNYVVYQPTQRFVVRQQPRYVAATTVASQKPVRPVAKPVTAPIGKPKRPITLDGPTLSEK